MPCVRALRGRLGLSAAMRLAEEQREEAGDLGQLPRPRGGFGQRRHLDLVHALAHDSEGGVEGGLDVGDAVDHFAHLKMRRRRRQRLQRGG